MSPGTAANAIRDLLDARLGSEVRVRVVLRALSFAGTDVIPDGGPALVAFVSRALAFALEEVGDRDFARGLVEELWQAVRDSEPGELPAARSGPVAATDWADQPTAHARQRVTTQSVPRRRWPIVFLVTRDRDRLSRFKVALSGKAQVECATDLFELTEGLDNTAGLLPIVVVDCPALGLPVGQLQPLLPTLPAQTTLVVWGAAKGVEAQQELVSTFGADTIGCSAEATPEDVAMLLMPFVG